jgi:hypothetical protein
MVSLLSGWVFAIQELFSHGGHPLSFTFHFIPGLQDKAAGLLFAIFPFFFFFQDAA